MTLTAENCREALKAVIDPEIYQNIVDLGLVYDVEVQPDDVVEVSMTLTTPHCPLGPQIIADVESVLTEHGAARVAVNIVWDPPWTPDAMTDDLKRMLGLGDDSPDQKPAHEPVVALDPPPAPPAAKKKGLLGRLFGR